VGGLYIARVSSQKIIAQQVVGNNVHELTKGGSSCEVINPTGRRVPGLSMRDDGGGKLVGERRWLPDYHNQDGVVP
jgi:hypothetical protein